MPSDSYQPPEMLTTERLRLRRANDSDAEALFENYCQDTHVTRYLGWKPHQNIQETRDFLKRCDACWTSRKSYSYTIISNKDNKVIGMIDMRQISSRVQFGYVLRQSVWGRGIAAEALNALVDNAFEQENIFRAEAFCDCENRPSMRVMEKSGMSYEGTLRRYFIHPNISDEPRDCKIYAKVK